jgi:hypothetical protein
MQCSDWFLALAGVRVTNKFVGKEVAPRTKLATTSWVIGIFGEAVILER